MLHLGPMNHTITMKHAFPNKHVQSHLKPAHTIDVKMWKVLVPICRVLYLWERDARSLKDYHAQTDSMVLSPQANYTDWVTATCQRNLVPTFVDRGVSRGQCGGSPTVVNLSFLDWLSYTAELKYEVVWCIEDKGNCKATAIFGVD
jgi:hypothetical protein